MAESLVLGLLRDSNRPYNVQVRDRRPWAAASRSCREQPEAAGSSR